VSDPGAGTDELVTARLALRPLRESDLDALAAIYADPAVMRLLGGPRTLVGRCGILVQDVEGAREHEIAYLLGSQWWGRGYATEAAAAIRDHARGTLGLDRLISLIAPENTPSKAVALRIGMWHERDLTFEGRPTSLFALGPARP
jgi:[ribosomal protein S5]-alanine N-acetyltransferase